MGPKIFLISRAKHLNLRFENLKNQVDSVHFIEFYLLHLAVTIFFSPLFYTLPFANIQIQITQLASTMFTNWIYIYIFVCMYIKIHISPFLDFKNSISIVSNLTFSIFYCFLSFIFVICCFCVCVACVCVRERER